MAAKIGPFRESHVRALENSLPVFPGLFPLVPVRENRDKKIPTHFQHSEEKTDGADLADLFVRMKMLRHATRK